MPADGDQNPYGVAFVPAGFPQGGKTHAGDILVSNFNNSNNLQGNTGSESRRVNLAIDQFVNSPPGSQLRRGLSFNNRLDPIVTGPGRTPRTLDGADLGRPGR
jgi:hypothetical protein